MGTECLPLAIAASTVTAQLHINERAAQLLPGFSAGNSLGSQHWVRDRPSAAQVE